MKDPAAKHRAGGPSQIACAVITTSDSRTEATDETGRYLKDALTAAGHRMEFYTVVRDDVGEIRAAVKKALAVARVVITDGGTGLAPRDVTLEALEPLWAKRMEGFGEIFRMLSYKQVGTAAMMSRAAAGTVQGGFVVCLPGSPKAARLALEEILLPELGHIVGLLDHGGLSGPGPLPLFRGKHDRAREHPLSSESHGPSPSPGAHAAHGELHGMRPLGKLLPVQAALARALEISRPVEETETVGLSEGVLRVLAEDVRSPTDVPAADKSAVDGYAVRSEDVQGASEASPKILSILEVLHAPTEPTRTVGPGTCTQVATGSLIPRGADAVVMVEFTEASGADVRVLQAAEAGKNIVRRGEDIRAGQTVLRAGETLTPGRLGAAATLGVDRLRVYRRPRVAIIVTGDEVVPPGKPLPPGGVYDVNGFTLAAVVRSSGGDPLPSARIRDSLEALDRAFDDISGVDLVAFTGGSSAGQKDLVLDLVKEKGEVLVHGVAIKPGRPLLLGRIGGRPVVGMPGFPTSALTCCYLFLGPMVQRMARTSPRLTLAARVPLAEAVVSVKGRTDVVPVRLEGGRAVPIVKGSASITAVSPADGYIVVPEDIEGIEAGREVDVLPF